MEFKKIIAGAFVYVAKYRQVLLKALAIPFGIYLLIDALALLDLHPLLRWVFTALGIGVQAIFAITTHRVVLLGPSSVSTWGITSWTKRETAFVLHILGLSLLMIPFGLVGIVPVVGAVVALFLICWVTGRLSLVFPGIAVDKGVSFKESWEMTENYQILMFLVVILFPVLLAIPVIVLNFIPYTFLLASFISTVVVVFQVAALSMAYQLISNEI
ncbi:MAG: hypothetical protein KBT72_06290 [Zhongshania sp.]|nr:hypothetical protein [Zhongshania sp.]